MGRTPILLRTSYPFVTRTLKNDAEYVNAYMLLVGIWQLLLRIYTTQFVKLSVLSFMSVHLICCLNKPVLSCLFIYLTCCIFLFVCTPYLLTVFVLSYLYEHTTCRLVLLVYIRDLLHFFVFLLYITCCLVLVICIPDFLSYRVCLYIWLVVLSYLSIYLTCCLV